MSVLLWASMSLTPVYLQCQVSITIPTLQVIDNVSIFAVGNDWEFDDNFSKITGVSKVLSYREAEELKLGGGVKGSPNARFEALVAAPELDDDRFLLDWRVYEKRGTANESTLEMSGIGICKQVLPSISENDAS